MKIELLTLDEAASALEITKRTLYRLMNSGDLAYYQVGSRRKISQRQIQNYLSSVLVKNSTKETEQQ